MKYSFTLLSILFCVSLLACKKDKKNVKEPDAVLNEAEIITTVRLTFTEIGNDQNVLIYQFLDLDGEGGNAPSIDEILLSFSTSYDVDIQVLNESVNPVENITEEILEESNAHLFCFESSTPSLIVNRVDTDGSYEIGLRSEWITSSANLGSIKVTLKHQDGTKDGTCSPGDTDIEIDFPIKIE